MGSAALGDEGLFAKLGFSILSENRPWDILFVYNECEGHRQLLKRLQNMMFMPAQNVKTQKPGSFGKCQGYNVRSIKRDLNLVLYSQAHVLRICSPQSGFAPKLALLHLHPVRSARSGRALLDNTDYCAKE